MCVIVSRELKKVESGFNTVLYKLLDMNENTHEEGNSGMNQTLSTFR